MTTPVKEGDRVTLTDDEQRAMKAILAVIDVCDSNWPSPTDITIKANGSNSACVSVPTYVLRKLLRDRSQ